MLPSNVLKVTICKFGEHRRGKSCSPWCCLRGDATLSVLTQGGILGSSSRWRCRLKALSNAAPGKPEFHRIARKYGKYFSGRWGQRGGAGQGDPSVLAPPRLPSEQGCLNAFYVVPRLMKGPKMGLTKTSCTSEQKSMKAADAVTGINCINSDQMGKRGVRMEVLPLSRFQRKCLGP